MCSIQYFGVLLLYLSHSGASSLPGFGINIRVSSLCATNSTTTITGIKTSQKPNGSSFVISTVSIVFRKNIYYSPYNYYAIIITRFCVIIKGFNRILRITEMSLYIFPYLYRWRPAEQGREHSAKNAQKRHGIKPCL